MIKYKFIFTFVIVIVYLILLYVEFYSLNKEKKVYLKDLNVSIVDINKSIYIDLDNIVPSSFKDWGLKKSFILKKREKRIKKTLENIHVNSLKDKNFNIKNRTICLEKECWEFVGIVKIGKKVGVTLLSKKRNSKLKTFKIGDYLLDDLKIVSIKDNLMILQDNKKNKKFSLKLFDVDISKYKPKKIKEDIKGFN